MESTNYFLYDDHDRDVIIHRETGLRINVFGLEIEDFKPTSGELHLFGDDHGEWLAFETEGRSIESIDIITGAVVWYTRYLDYSEMNITTEDPRPPFNLKKL